MDRYSTQILIQALELDPLLDAGETRNDCGGTLA